MPDYIIDFTDPANGSFVIKPYTTNGPLTPINPTPLDPQAVSANTSIVLLGQGMYAYGERFQESIVHMLEHFSYESRPYYPIQGQIWYKNANFVDVLNPTDPVDSGLYLWDGAAWQTIVIGSLPLTGDLDMNGFNIINLGTPADPSDDAVSVNFANSTYLRLDATNDPVTGVLTVANDIVLTGGLSQVTLPNAPTAGTDAVNRDYVLGLSLNDHVDVAIIGPLAGEFLQYNGVDWTNVATAIPTTLDSLSDVIITAPVVNEVLTFDGLNWINQAPAASADRYVQSATMTTTGTTPGTTLRLVVDTSPSTLPVNVDATGIAPYGHTHSSSDMFHDENPQSFDSSYIRTARVSTTASQTPTFPQLDPFNNVVDALDQAVYATRGPVKRRILQGDGTTTVFTPPEYVTYTNKLSVSINGVKQYASMRGTATLLLDGLSTAHSASDTGLSVADFVITAVNTGTETFTIVGNFASTFPAGTEFSVLGSTGNDGLWEVSSASNVGPNTDIVINTTPTNPNANINITNATADGIVSVVDVDDYEFDIVVDAVDGPPPGPGTVITVRPAPLEISLAVASVDATLDDFTVSGDYTSVFSAGRIFVVTGSTGNNGNWTVGSSTFLAGNTVISVTGDITSSVIDGTISVAYVSMAGLTEEITFELATAAVPATAFFRDSALLFIPDSQGNTSTVELLDNSGGGTSLMSTLAATYAASEILYDSYGSEVDILSSTAPSTFTVVGDYTAAFPTGTRFIVQGTDGFTAGISPFNHGTNDGVYEVASSAFGGVNTTIVVTSVAVTTFAAATPGTIYFARDLGYDESGTPFDAATPGSNITFATAPTAGALIEVTVAP